MSARRAPSGFSGILLVDKPAGLTSHDVVNRVRRAMSERRIGHAGTLDPMATGLLVVLVGPATRMAPYLTAAEKSYLARIEFGFETDTDDAEGEITRTADVPTSIRQHEFAAEKVAALVGVHDQVPPVYSAIKRDGQVAHRAARAGAEVVLEPRAVEISSASLVAVRDATAAWDVELLVSKGTYIRAIARDLGRQLGTAAHLSALRRTASGTLHVDRAVPLDFVTEAAEPCEIAERFADPVSALGLPALEVGEQGAARVTAGSVLDASTHCSGECPAEGPVAIVREGVLLAVYSVWEGVLRAQTVFPGGVRGGSR